MNPQTEGFLVFLMLVCMFPAVALIVLGWLLSKAPQGYEDESGWHPGQQR